MDRRKLILDAHDDQEREEMYCYKCHQTPDEDDDEEEEEEKKKREEEEEEEEEDEDEGWSPTPRAEALEPATYSRITLIAGLTSERT